MKIWLFQKSIRVSQVYFNQVISIKRIKKMTNIPLSFSLFLFFFSLKNNHPFLLPLSLKNPTPLFWKGWLINLIFTANISLIQTMRFVQLIGMDPICLINQMILFAWDQFEFEPMDCNRSNLRYKNQKMGLIIWLIWSLNRMKWIGVVMWVLHFWSARHRHGVVWTKRSSVCTHMHSLLSSPRQEK